MQKQDGTAGLYLAEWLRLLTDRDSSSRETKRFESRMRTAKLRHVGASPEDVDYKSRRGLDKAQSQQMLTGRWIKDKRNLMIDCLTGDALHRREEPAPFAIVSRTNGVPMAYSTTPTRSNSTDRACEKTKLKSGDESTQN